MPLSYAKPGLVKVISINGGRKLREKLLRMGIMEGEIIKVIFNSFPGPVIVQKYGSRIGIGAGMASKIIVQLIGGDK